MSQLKNLFLLDPEVIFLNHGSFGATPRPVFEAYQNWQRELERQPVRFLGRELFPRLEHARQALARTLHTEADDLAYIPNTTFGVNLVARSLNLQPGDEVLTTNHEYGACDNAWEFVCQKTGASYIRQPISLPVRSSEKIVGEFWGGVTARTKIIFISHITSQTALQMPVEDICTLARGRGILTLVDGAHAPGQIPLNVGEVGADFYVGNCHKWMLSPKGAAFLHACPRGQALLDPLVVSWGWGKNSPFTTGSPFLDALQWTGTDDPSACLAVPAAIQFQKDHNWPEVRKRCRQLLEQSLERASQITGMPSIYPQGERLYHQMAVVPLPPINDLEGFQKALYQGYKIEIPAIEWQGRHFLRISVQGYNSEEDLDIFLGALGEMLGSRRSGEQGSRRSGEQEIRGAGDQGSRPSYLIS